MTTHRIIAADWQLQAAQQGRLGAVIVPLVPEPVFNKKRPQDFANWYTFISQTRPSQIMWYEGFSATDTLKFHLRWKEGDRLYLAEEWVEIYVNSFPDYIDWAKETPVSKSVFLESGESENDDDLEGGWQPAATMPPEAAQYWYEVLGGRVVQMRDLVHSEIIGDGATKEEIFDGSDGAWERFWGIAKQNWNAAHPDHLWDADRWVVVLSLKEVAQ